MAWSWRLCGRAVTCLSPSPVGEETILPGQAWDLDHIDADHTAVQNSRSAIALAPRGWGGKEEATG